MNSYRIIIIIIFFILLFFILSFNFGRSRQHDYPFKYHPYYHNRAPMVFRAHFSSPTTAANTLLLAKPCQNR